MLYVLTSSQCQGLLHSDLCYENAIILINDEPQTNNQKLVEQMLSAASVDNLRPT